MSSETDPFANLPVKLVAAVVVAVLLVVGIAGLVLPFVPGLVFLAVAAVVAAKYLPGLDQMLRRNATASRYLDEVNGLAALPLGKQAQLAGLLFVKALIDAVTLLISTVTKLVRAAARA
jgi:uncharacterized membrane protein YbaN (DUF454 family)